MDTFFCRDALRTARERKSQISNVAPEAWRILRVQAHHYCFIG
jgi:hypothetical protein